MVLSLTSNHYFNRGQSPPQSPKLVAEDDTPRFYDDAKSIKKSAAATAGKKFRLSRTKAFFNPLFEAKDWFIESTSDAFESFAYFVFDNPWYFIIIPTIICLIFSIGFIFRERELDMDLLYSLPVSTTTLARDEIAKVFPIERSSYVFAVSQDGSGLLSHTVFTKLFALWMLISDLHIPRALVDEGAALPGSNVVSEWLHNKDPSQISYHPFDNISESKKIDYSKENNNSKKESIINESRMKENITLNDVCARDGNNKCKIVSPLDLYISKAQWGNPLIASDYPTFFNAKTERIFRLDSLLSGIELKVFEQKTVVFNFTGVGFRIDLDGRENLMQEAAIWEQGLITLIKNININGVKLYVRTERSINDELSNSSLLSGKDLVMLILASVSVSIFTVLMNASLHWYRSKAFPAFVGIITTLLAYGGGVGLWHLIGLPHVPPAEATPFMVLGICVDDIFVITNAYSLSYIRSDDARSRIGLAIRDAGVSITITTLTNIVAFGIGATSVFYSIYVFCILTASGLLFGYLLCLTVFLGALSLSAKREEKYTRSLKTKNEIELNRREKNDQIIKSYSHSYSSSSIFDTSIEILNSKSMNNLEHNKLNYMITNNQIKISENNNNINYDKQKSSLNNNDNNNYSKNNNNNNNNNNILIDNNLENKEKEFEIYSPIPCVPIVKQDNNENFLLDKKEFHLKDGIYSIEDLDNFLIISERVRHELQEINKLYEKSSTSLDYTRSSTISLNKKNDTNDFDMSVIPRLVKIKSKLIPLKNLDLTEPKGTVGFYPRQWFMKNYGVFLIKKKIKIIIILSFLLGVCLSIYGSLNLKAGLQLKDVTPYNSYLRDFYETREKLFSKYGDEVLIVFPFKGSTWWDPLTQNLLLQLQAYLESSTNEIVFVFNGFVEFLKHYHTTKVINRNNKEVFMSELIKWLNTTTKGKIVSDMFIIENNEIKSMKFYYWMTYLDNTQIAINRLQKIRKYINKAEKNGLPKSYVYTPLAVHWESDLTIVKATITNMLAALISMGIVALVLITDFRSGLMVLIVIIMIDLCVMGIMPLLKLNVNMLTMVNLVLSIGFAVDYTAHITHCFTHCKGPTRDHRVIEALILMGQPITNGMLSTYGAVGVLAFSGKYILVVVFQMMTAVLFFAFIHGIVFMPILLSLIGPFKSYNVEVVHIQNNKLKENWTVTADTGKIIHKLHYRTAAQKKAIQTLFNS